MAQVLPRLFPHDWPDAPRVVCRRLAPGLDESPWLAFVEAGSGRRAPIEAGDLEALERAAIEALTARGLRWKVAQRDESRAPEVLEISDRMAAEVVLLPALLREAQRQLGTRGVGVVIPTADRVEVHDAFHPDWGRLAEVAAGAARRHALAARRPVCPDVLVVQDGVIVGAVTAPEVAAAAAADQGISRLRRLGWLGSTAALAVGVSLLPSSLAALGGAFGALGAVGLLGLAASRRWRR